MTMLDCGNFSSKSSGDYSLTGNLQTFLKGDQMKINFYPSVGEICRLKRGRLNISQQELSMRSGISHQTISAIENDRRIPSLKTLKKLANALDLKADERDAFIDAMINKTRQALIGGEK